MIFTTSHGTGIHMTWLDLFFVAPISGAYEQLSAELCGKFSWGISREICQGEMSVGMSGGDCPRWEMSGEERPEMTVPLWLTHRHTDWHTNRRPAELKTSINIFFVELEQAYAPPRLRYTGLICISNEVRVITYRRRWRAPTVWLAANVSREYRSSRQALSP